MKTKLFLLVLTLVSFGFYSCDEDDDNLNVSKEYRTAFNSMYPDVSRVSWEREGGYYVAEFWRNDLNAEAEAWFSQSAEWMMTVTELRYAAFPQSVKDGFLLSEYKDWRIDDTDMVERPNKETLYIIEVERNQQEYDLYFTADGVLVKAIRDVDNNHSGYLS